MAIYNNSKYVDYSQILNALFNISTAPFKYVTIQNAKIIKACFFGNKPSLLKQHWFWFRLRKSNVCLTLTC